MSKKRIVMQILQIVVGIVLLGLGVAGKVDEFWSGMGGALIGVGAMHLAQMIRYEKNEKYRENVNVKRSDERNRFLAMRAWQLAGGWFTVIAAIGTFIFKFAGREDLMLLCSSGVCLLITLYWICFLCLKKKY